MGNTLAWPLYGVADGMVISLRYLATTVTRGTRHLAFAKLLVSFSGAFFL